MPKNTFCSIITGNYGHYVLALHDSMLEYNSDICFAVLVSCGDLDREVKAEIESRNNFNLYNIKDLSNHPLAAKIKDKYYDAFHDGYRWSMKPILINFLLEKNFDKVIYVDWDIFFFNNYSFLWDQLNRNDLLLSPHWRSSDPEKDLPNFKLNFLDGIFNGGFIGASKGAATALNYWAKLCLFKCERDRDEGFYVDQRYLDLLPTRFDRVGYLTHRGCNVAYWNQVDCARNLGGTGEVLINDEFPIVFIHFTHSFFLGVLTENDKLLLSYLLKYRNVLNKYSSKDIIEEFYKKEKSRKKFEDSEINKFSGGKFSNIIKIFKGNNRK